MKETEEQAIERRKRMYGCDGRCYYDNGVCGGIDTCDETRVSEGIASAMAVLLIIGTPVVIIVAMVFFIISRIGG